MKLIGCTPDITPLAVIVKVPELRDEVPAGDGAPTSLASHGAGTAACTALAAPHIAKTISNARIELKRVNRMNRSPLRASDRLARTVHESFGEEAHLRLPTLGGVVMRLLDERTSEESSGGKVFPVSAAYKGKGGSSSTVDGGTKWG